MTQVQPLPGPTFGQKVYQGLTAAVQWAWDNKPYIVAIVAAVTGGLQAAGVPVPPWLYGVYVGLGGAALHSSVKAS